MGVRWQALGRQAGQQISVLRLSGSSDFSPKAQMVAAAENGSGVPERLLRLLRGGFKMSGFAHKFDGRQYFAGA